MSLKFNFSQTTAGTNIAYVTTLRSDLYNITYNYNTINEFKSDNILYQNGTSYGGTISLPSMSSLNGNHNTFILYKTNSNVPYKIYLSGNSDKTYVDIMKTNNNEYCTFMPIPSKQDVTVNIVPLNNGNTPKFYYYYINLAPYTIFTDKYELKDNKMVVYPYMYICNKSTSSNVIDIVDKNNKSILINEMNNCKIEIVRKDSVNKSYIAVYFTEVFYNKYGNDILYIVYYNKEDKIYNYKELLYFYPVYITNFFGKKYYFHKDLSYFIEDEEPFSVYYKSPEIIVKVQQDSIFKQHYITISKGIINIPISGTSNTYTIDLTDYNDEYPLYIYYYNLKIPDYGHKKIQRESSIITKDAIVTKYIITSDRNYNVFDKGIYDVKGPSLSPANIMNSNGIDVYYQDYIIDNSLIKKDNNYPFNNYLIYSIPYLFTYDIRTTYTTFNSFIEFKNINVNPVYNSSLHGTAKYVLYDIVSGLYISDIDNSNASGIFKLATMMIKNFDTYLYEINDTRRYGEGVIPLNISGIYTDYHAWEEKAHQRNYVYISGISGIVNEFDLESNI